MHMQSFNFLNVFNPVNIGTALSIAKFIKPSIPDAPAGSNVVLISEEPVFALKSPATPATPVINESIKRLKKNYYNLRSKKVANLIKTIEKSRFKRTTLGGCIFNIKKDNLCLKIEKT